MATFQVPNGLRGRLITSTYMDDRSGAPSPAEPVLWVTDDLLNDDEAGRLWASLLPRHRETGLWPLLLGNLDHLGRPWHAGELVLVPPSRVEEVNVGEWLAEGWGEAFDEEFREDDEEPFPFDAWPGPAPTSEPGADPDLRAVEVATSPSGVRDMLTGTGHGPFLGLVPARDGAEAVIASGWPADAGHEAITAVLRTWQERFGVRVCSLGFDTLNVTVAWPPRTLEHARRVAAEHYAFCPDHRQQEYGFEEYAAAIVGAPVWSFWWD